VHSESQILHFLDDLARIAFIDADSGFLIRVAGNTRQGVEVIEETPAN